MNHDLPQISACNNVSNTYVMSTSSGTGLYDLTKPYDPYGALGLGGYVHAAATYDGAKTKSQLEELENQMAKKEKREKSMSNGRVVQVFIVDPDKNLPVSERLVYMGDQLFTDMTDQDLFFDIDIKKILTAHNEARGATIDKKRSSATEKVYLEPVRVSDLKMVVSVIASF